MEEDFQCLKEENSLLRNEMQMLKTRNNRLIDQLREKSVMLSRLQDHTSGIEEQVSYSNMANLICSLLVEFLSSEMAAK